MRLLAPELPLFAAIEAIYQRAAHRGENDPDGVAARMRTLPFDLLRAELMMTLRPAADAVLAEIVDTPFLPLVQA